MNLVEKKRGESTVSQVNIRQVSDARRILSDLGVSFSDVFGAEQIVWVEGETEQEAFPRIIAASGTPTFPSFLAVKHTGDFNKKGVKASTIYGIYEKLSAAMSILPVTVRFSFDREKMTPVEVDDLIRRSGGAVHILPRRTFENYLLHSRAITEVIWSELSDDNESITEQAVLDWISSNGSKYSRVDRAKDEAGWLRDADIPNLLKSMFQELTSARLEFRKPYHPLLLTDWLLAHDSPFLDELKKYVMQFAKLE